MFEMAMVLFGVLILSAIYTIGVYVGCRSVELEADD